MMKRLWRYSGIVRRIVLALLVAGTVQAAQIERIEIQSETGAPVPENLVRANMRSRAGAQFQPQVLTEDIKRLYATQIFEDVRVEVSELDNGDVVITVSVIGRRVVRQILIVGNRQIKTKRLRALVEHEEGVPLDEVQMTADVNALRERYRDSRYYTTEVEAEVQPIPNTAEVNLLFRIHEEERARLGSIRFTGNTILSDRQLRRRIQTRRSWWSRIFHIGGFFDEYTLELDHDLLRTLYTDRGYLDFAVEQVQREYNEKRTKVSLTFHLHEGEPYTVTSVTVRGNQRFSDEELQDLIQLETDQVYDATVERFDIQRITGKYEVLGYLDFRCIPLLTPDSQALTVAVEYSMDEGRVFHIRDILILGNEVTKDHVIRRELAIHPGDLGDASKIRTSRARLMNLNYFETVELNPVTTETEDEKNLRVEVVEKRTGQLMLGAGFSSEDAMLGFVELTQANFDWRNWPTFRGAGQRLRLRTQLGTERTDFVLSFSEPWWMGRRLRLDLDAYSHLRSEDEYDQETLGFGAAVTRRWRTFWRQSVGVRVQRIELSDFDLGVSPELLSEQGSYTANSITLGLSRDTRNRFVNPSRGSRLSLSTELIPEALGSYSDIWRLDLEGSKYFPLFSKSVLKVHTEIGIVDKIGGDQPAIFHRYFSGGAYSIRGFERREISPVDVNEDPVGGKSMFLGSVELIHPLFEKVYGSVFCDAGNVWRDVNDLNPGEINASVGIGLQINLPIGPIRFDYGWPVARELGHLKNRGRLHFNLGYFF